MWAVHHLMGFHIHLNTGWGPPSYVCWSKMPWNNPHELVISTMVTIVFSATFVFGNWTGARTGAPSSQSDILSGDPRWSPKAQQQSELEMLTASMEAKIQLFFTDSVGERWFWSPEKIQRKHQKTPKNTMIFWHILSSKIPKHDFGVKNEYLQHPPKFQHTQTNAPEIWRVLEDHVYWKNGCLENFEHFFCHWLCETRKTKPSRWSTCHRGYGFTSSMVISSMEIWEIPWINPINQSHYEMMVFLARKIAIFCCHPKKHTYAIHSLVICSIAMENHHFSWVNPLFRLGHFQ